MLKRTSRLTLAMVVTALSAMTLASRAQQIYLQNFNSDDSANWAVNFSYTAGATFNGISNSLVNFNFDYTSAGIPIAPHSALFGSTGVHHGLKMSACYTNTATLKTGAATAGLSVCPTNFSVTANFIMHADVWMNVDCTAFAAADTNYAANSTASMATTSHNSTASTVFYGCGYGTQGTTATTPGLTDAIWVGALTDNGTSAQYRMYGPSVHAEASYQDGDHQTSGSGTPSFPGDPFVYNIGNGVNGLGTRNMITTTANPPYTPNQLATNLATGTPWRNILPPQAAPTAQAAIYPQQTNNYSLPGFLDFAWHDVSLEKVGNVIIYKIDGNIIATGNYASAGTPPGSFLTFVATRTGTSVANSVSGNQYTNLNFVVFANIVVSNYNNVVNVAPTTPTCDEGVPSAPGVFTITRSSAGVPLTVNYTLTGSATNGVQYQTLPTSLTFSSTDTSTNINVTPIDDGIPNPTTTVVLTLLSGTGYQGAGNAVVNILDTDMPTIDISGTSQAYGRYTNLVQGNNDFVAATVTRRGKLSTGADLSVNLTYGGAAVPNADFVNVASVTVPDGAATATLNIPPVDDITVTSNLSFTISTAAGTGYAIGNSTATGTIVTAHYPAATILLTNDLSSSDDVTNWNVIYGCGNPDLNSTDFNADFGFPLASAPSAAIPAPPNGNANALHLTCNKAPAPSAPGAVNCYYTNLFLSGNYAVRFNMNIVEGSIKNNATEGAVFGINHSGSLSNWWYSSGFITNQSWSSDGIWYYVTAQPGVSSSSGDYAEYTGAGGTNGNTGWTRIRTNSQTSFSSVFKANPGPFTCLDTAFNNPSAGMPANGSPVLGFDDSTWADVEIKQVNGVVTMSINHTPIFVYTNFTVWQSGYLMLGYADPYGDSIGSTEAGVYYANLQVVSLPAVTVIPIITIKNISISGSNVIITFTTSSPTDTISSFTLRSSSTVTGTYTDVSPAATITSLGGGQFQASTPYNSSNGTLFYRIFHP